ncbi:MAG TPA: T9SS type A sorting domain-containing protein [Bacteroidales bacterium]|nr:T9SS type A sorting domain-containing protein [Bacteroidales bacterium]HRZ48427.1 T9SS type A sorting domain-containing protein [Bacteroidales bacterium]
MKKTVPVLVVLFFLMFAPNISRGSHIASLDLSLVNIGGNDYLVTFVLYRDCSGISAPQTVPLNFACTGNPAYSFNLSSVPLLPNSGQEVTVACPGMPTRCSGGTIYGIQEYMYQSQVTLPACNSWVVSYSTCCRNPSNTIQAPISTSAYIEARLNNLDAPGASAPTMTTIPTLLLCNGKLNCQNPGAVDKDGDSLSFKLVTPFNSSSTTYVTYIPPYTPTQPLPSNPPVTLDPLTGELCVTPSMNIVAPIAIKVEKWRTINGTPTQIGTTYRDMQVNVYNCTSEIPVLSGMDTTLSAGYNPGNTLFSKTICAGQPFSMAVWGNDADTFNAANSGNPEKFAIFWNQAIQGAGFNAIHQGTDSAYALFNWTPTPLHIRQQPWCFVATVRDYSCPYNLTRHYSYCFKVEGIAVDAGPDKSGCIGDVINFQATTPTAGVVYQWAVDGVPAGPYQASNVFALNTQGMTTGSHTISVTVNNAAMNLACPGVDLVVLSLHPVPQPYLGPDTAILPGNTILLDAGTGYTNYLWSNGQTTQTVAIDSTATGMGIKTVWVLVADLNGCSGSDTILIHFTQNPGMEEWKKSITVQVSPNPAGAYALLSLQGNQTSAEQVEIISVDGKSIVQQQDAKTEIQPVIRLDLRDLPDGIYLVRVTLQDGSVGTTRLIISR